MKAPDKIYINKFEANVSEDTKAIGVAFTEQLDTRFIEYIHKDALLDWARDMVDEYERLLVGFPDNGSNWAKKRAFEELIDKLKSM